jgi:hypothetical protein
MTYKLTLTTTSTAQADGVAVNTATAKLMLDNTYPTGENIIFTVTGRALFDNGTQSKSSPTGANGVVSVSFTDTVAETVTVIAVPESAPSEMKTALSVFSNATPDDNELTLNVLVDNAKANGIEKNQVQALVRSKSSLQPVPNVTCYFTVPAGSAKFDNGSKAYTSQTDVTGVCNAYLTDTSVEAVAVTATIPGNQTQIQTVTFTGGDPLRITQAATLTGKPFTSEAPTTAWIGAEFQILFSGGSGTVDWSVNNTGLAVQDASSYEKVILKFAETAETGIRYTVTGTDRITGEVVTYTFLLNDFYVSFGSVETLDVIWTAGNAKYLPSPTQLHNLYAEWGSMSDYGGWTEKDDVYWTDSFDLVVKATVVNVSTNEESVVLVPAMHYRGYAKLSNSKR